MAVYYAELKKPEKVIETLTQLLDADDKAIMALRARADAYLNLGKQAEAIHDYESALKLDPRDSGVLNNLAWVLATSPDEKLRDGRRSIELGQRACELTDYKQAHILSTLAAGYAESGDFDSAIKWSKRAVEDGSDKLKPQLGKELESYEHHKAWRELLPEEPVAEDESTDDQAASGGDAQSE
jgi:tetratricopeptide (TPR) repeat protein